MVIEHILLAILIQLLVRIISGSWISGTIAASAWFLSREIAQAEYRWIEQFGSGLRANMPWWGGFDLRVWQKVDPWLDWLLPCLTVVAIALIAGWRNRRPVKS